jgi:glutamate formiminotransferase/glutamate formiminotransferase/formiminotetrahydrofolate cyclodeaminase
MADLPLLGVPNFSEGRDPAVIEALERALEGNGAGGRAGGSQDGGTRLLDAHSDTDHNRSVFTLAAPSRLLADALLRAAAVAVEEIDVMGPAGEGHPLAGQHPHVGALDVAPIVYVDPQLRGPACAEALVLGDRIADQLDIPVFLYGELTAAAGTGQRTRAELRRGGVAGLAGRMADPEDPLVPDFGPPRLHPTAGAVLVAAREPLVAFNLLLSPEAGLGQANSVAASIREGGPEGLPGVRAIGVMLEGRGAQVSLNVERPFEVPLAEVVAAVRRLAPVASGELVGLAPRAAFEGFPEDIPVPGFDPQRHLLENALLA